MKKMNYALACGALLLSTSAFAQDRQTVIFEGGAVQDYEVFTYYPNAVTYNVVVEFDPTATLVSDSGTSKTYANAVTYFNVELVDAQGNVLAGPSVAWDIDTMGANITPNVTFRNESYGDYLSFDINVGQGEIGHWIDLAGAQGTLYSDFSGFPQFTTGPSTASVDYIHLAMTQSWNPHFDVYGPLTSISYLVEDTDGDGLADNVDACVASNLDETVAFGGWYETGVTNYMDESGCSIMDHYAACEAESESTAPAGPVFSSFAGPSYCETSVGYSLQGEGVIDYTESRMLRNALYNYHRSGSQPR